MARTSVRRVQNDSTDMASFERLWTDSRVASGQTRDWASRMIRDGRLIAAVEHPDVRVFLAHSGADATGYVVVVRSPLSTLSAEPAVWIDQLYVDPAHRRSGVARSLLAVVPITAESIGAGVITAAVPAGHRDTNRFFARLGFTNTTTLRSTTVAALRRHLEPELAGERAGGQAVVRLRRSMRGRARTRQPRVS
ncbi:GNAT family N-acetyltransferase [Yimella sp. cx-573]|nr:GNAT family N-acetyltransferase [Yimella sp. cx-573]